MPQRRVAAARRLSGVVARRNAARGRRLPAASAIDALLPPDVRVAAALARFRRNVAVRGRRTGSCSSSCRSCRSSCRRRSCSVGRSAEAPGHVANGLVPAASALAARVLRYSRISAVDALRRRPDVAVWLRAHLGAVETPRHVANRLVPATLALSVSINQSIFICSKCPEIHRGVYPPKTLEQAPPPLPFRLPPIPSHSPLRSRPP